MAIDDPTTGWRSREDIETDLDFDILLGGHRRQDHVLQHLCATISRPRCQESLTGVAGRAAPRR